MDANTIHNYPRIAVLPTPGMGHLIPLAEFAKLLVSRHNFSVTFITYAASDSKVQKAFLDALPETINSIQLPPVSLSDLPDDARIETRISVATARSLPALRSLLLNLKHTARLVALVADLFGGDTFPVARDLGIMPCMFFPSNLQLLSFMFHLPELDAATTCEYRDLPAPLRLPGCVPLPGADLVFPVQERANECYPWMVHHARRYSEAQGIMVNSFEAMEPGAAKVLKEPSEGRPPVYLVGPLVQMGLPEVEGSECLRWLDEQPAGSVLFVSFGSGGTLTMEQMTELAMGLEMSGQRFLWVVRRPSDGDASANYFEAAGADDPWAYLPTGFLERTKGLGLVVRSWAPQKQVLSHVATGGFLSHCGWNSTLESVAHGVPMIAWPLYAEQRMNAVMLVEGTRLAVRPIAREDGVYGRGEISRVVKALMEGEEGKKLRSRAKELQEAGEEALADGGASSKALAELVNKWRSAVVATDV